MIKEHKFVVRFFYDTEIFSEDQVANMPIEGILYEMNEGSMVGQVEDHGAVTVPRRQVEQKLLEIGNDGTFFEGV